MPPLFQESITIYKYTPFSVYPSLSFPFTHIHFPCNLQKDPLRFEHNSKAFDFH